MRLILLFGLVYIGDAINTVPVTVDETAAKVLAWIVIACVVMDVTEWVHNLSK